MTLLGCLELRCESRLASVRRHPEFAPRRRGVDRDQVREFQALVADEFSALHQQVRLLSQENDRLKRALRDWQTMHARECRPPQEYHTNEGHW